MDLSERVLEALSIVGGASQDASRNPYAALKDEVPTGEFPRVDDVSVEASLIEVTDEPPPRARWARFTIDGARRPLDRLVLSSYVKRMEWARPIADVPAPDQEIAWALINYWKPFD